MHRRKHYEIQQVLDNLGLEEVDERLRLATSIPATPSYRFAALVQVVVCIHELLENLTSLVFNPLTAI